MAGIVKQKLKIIGMHCTSCALNIDWDLEDVPGVKSAKTSYSSQECTVEFDNGAVAIEQIIQTVQKTGYQAETKKE